MQLYIDQFKKLARMMFTPGNKELWMSFLIDNFVIVDGGSIEEAIDFVAGERDLLFQEIGMNSEEKIERLIPSLKSRLEFNG